MATLESPTSNTLTRAIRMIQILSSPLQEIVRKISMIFYKSNFSKKIQSFWVRPKFPRPMGWRVQLSPRDGVPTRSTAWPRVSNALQKLAQIKHTFRHFCRLLAFLISQHGHKHNQLVIWRALIAK